ncbi:MAG: PAS domain-containing protein, partial [Arcobacteraceae bacterium]
MKILKKQSKNYTINDIENLFTLIPTLFILILATFSLVISFLIIDFKQKKDFELIKQKKILNFKFEKKDQLYKFSDEVENKVNKRFSYVKAQLQETIFKTVGYWDAKFSNKLNLNDLLIYLNKFEKNEGVQFVIFEKESLKILYGKDMILHLQQVMFNNPNTKKFKKLTLQYIASQGKNNLQSWKYDLQKNLILSYFDVTKIKEKEYLIGVFSSINNIKQLTKEIIISSIKEMTSPVDYDIWFYDSNTKKTFNFNNKQQFKTSADILFDVDKKTKKHEILDYYQSNDDENKNYSKQLYYYSKYSYFIGIDYNKNILKEKDARIKMIVKEYKALFLKTFLFITAITAIMLLFSFIFSNFIKNIFGKYHLELKIKTDSLEHWKKRFELAIIASNDGLWDIDFKTKKIYFSDKWLDMFGYNEGEV